jgi:hypothetical protein
MRNRKPPNFQLVMMLEEEVIDTTKREGLLYSRMKLF